jgi:hypothetical protein
VVAIKQMDGVVLLLTVLAAAAAVVSVVLFHQHQLQQMHGKNSKERSSNLAAAGRLGYESG